MLSKDQAQVELKKLMMTKEYLKGHKPTVARVQALTRVAHATRRSAGDDAAGLAEHNCGAGERTQQDARAEAAALIKKNAKSGTSGPRPMRSASWNSRPSCNAQVDQPLSAACGAATKELSWTRPRAGDRSAGEKKPTEREIRLEMLAIMRADGYEVGRDVAVRPWRSRSSFGSLMADNVREQAIKNLARAAGRRRPERRVSGLEK